MAKKAGEKKQRRSIYTDGPDPRKIAFAKGLLNELAVLSTIDEKYGTAAQAAGGLVKALLELEAGEALE